MASQPVASGLSPGTIAGKSQSLMTFIFNILTHLTTGIVIALLLGIILMAILIALSVGIFYIRKKKRFSAEFRENHIQADQEARSGL